MAKDNELTTIQKTELTQVINRLFDTKTPAKFIKTRPGAGGKPVRYVEVGYIINELNRAFGAFWEFKVVDKQVGKKQIWVQGQLTVKDFKTNFSITKETFGGADIKFRKDNGEVVDIANDLKAAVSDCIKKCASMFGIAADVFFREQDLYDQMPTVIDVENGTKESLLRIVQAKYFAVAAKLGFEGEDAKQKAKKRYQVESFNDISIEDLTKYIDEMEAFAEEGGQKA